MHELVDHLGVLLLTLESHLLLLIEVGQKTLDNELLVLRKVVWGSKLLYNLEVWHAKFVSGANLLIAIKLGVHLLLHLLYLLKKVLHSLGSFISALVFTRPSWALVIKCLCYLIQLRNLTLLVLHFCDEWAHQILVRSDCFITTLKFGRKELSALHQLHDLLGLSLIDLHTFSVGQAIVHLMALGIYLIIIRAKVSDVTLPCLSLH